MQFRSIPRQWSYLAIRVLSLVALSFAAALAVDYYFSANTFCGVGASCDVVAKSDFGQRYGKFLPTLGLTTYSLLFFASFVFPRAQWRVFGRRLSTFWVPLAIVCAALGALLFVVVQAMEIDAFCWLCMGIDSSALLMVLPAVQLYWSERGDLASSECLGDGSCGACVRESCGCASGEESRGDCLHPLMWGGIYVLCTLGIISWGSFKVPPQSGELPDFVRALQDPERDNIVEISSFDCVRCRELHPSLNALLEEYGERVHFRRITIPLGKEREAVYAYACVEQQGSGHAKAFADELFEHSTKDPAELEAVAQGLGIDMEAYRRCVKDPELIRNQDERISALMASGFKGAPTVWVNNTAIVGYRSSQGLEAYRDALSSKERAGQRNLPFLAVLLLSLHLLGFGAVMQWRKRKKGSRSEA